jgi:hypothetical protein
MNQSVRGLKLKVKSYTATIIMLFVLSIASIKKIRQVLSWKQIGLFVLVSSLFGYAWTLTVNNCFDVPAWSFTKESFLGIIIWNTILEDFFFYPISATLFLWLIVTLDTVIKSFGYLKDKYAMIITFSAISAMFCFVDKIGLSIVIFFVIPAFVYDRSYVFFKNKVFLLLNLILIPASGLWDLWSTTIAPLVGCSVQWYYPESLYTGWIWNSPISITPFFTIAGVFFSYFLYIRIRYNHGND